MKLSTIWGHLKMESTPLLMFSLILISTSMKGEATPPLEKIAAPGQIQEPQLEEIDVRAGM